MRRTEQDRLTGEGGMGQADSGQERIEPDLRRRRGRWGRNVTDRKKKTMTRQADRRRRNGTGGQEEAE
jgi:hypothetical protein